MKIILTIIAALAVTGLINLVSAKVEVSNPKEVSQLSQGEGVGMLGERNELNGDTL